MRRTFQQRAETFGLSSDHPWAMDTFRLLFHTPRAYAPLVDAWEARYPGTKAALDRLEKLGFVANQGPVIVDTRTGELADRQGPAVARYRATAKGKRLVEEMKSDLRVLGDAFENSDPVNHRGLARLLRAFDLEDSHARYGLSASHAIELSGLSLRTGRWWVARLLDDGYLRRLPVRLADTRAVVPAHWRITRLLCRQLSDVIEAFPEQLPKSLEIEFRLGRTRFLGDIDPARIGISGATDYDHDVECQRIVAAMVRSPRLAVGGLFMLEPRFHLPATANSGVLTFSTKGKHAVFYQPDAELREVADGTLRRVIVEYERYQSRRDAWAHIERFLGYLSVSAYPFELAALRFVVDSEPRVRAYRQLIEAFCDWCVDHPELCVQNPVTLSVSSAERVIEAADPLDDRVWHRIDLPCRSETGGNPVLHHTSQSPYDDYFSRAAQDSPEDT